MRQTTTIAVLIAAILIVGSSRAEEEKPTVEEKAPAFGDAANDMPLKLYQELKRNADALSGNQTADSAKQTKGDAQKALKDSVEGQAEVLIKALQASQVIHRQLAAVVLSFDDKNKAIREALEASLGSDPDVEVRKTVAGAIAGKKDAASVSVLINALGDTDETVRSICIQGLGDIGDNRAVTPLMKVLSKEENALLRMRAASCLGKIKEPLSLEALQTAMDAEKDLRVRMAIAGAIRKIRGKDTPATEGVPTTKSSENILTKLSKDMKGVEEKLRNDRHDQAVQVDQKKIEEQLSELIKMAQQAESQGQGKGQKQEKSQGKQPGSKGGKEGSGPKSPSSPLQDSSLSGAASRGALRPGEVEGIQDRWAKLPPHLRDEMLQIYREELPEFWKKRLEAYFMSVANEQTDK